MADLVPGGALAREAGMGETTPPATCSPIGKGPCSLPAALPGG
jgi:hypothetical protein